jgi:hypothetical protein
MTYSTTSSGSVAERQVRTACLQVAANSTRSINVASSASAFELLTRFDVGREGAALVLSQSLCDALLDRFVLRPQRHLIILRVLFDFRTAGRGRLLYCCLVGLVFCFGECWSQKEVRTR